MRTCRTREAIRPGPGRLALAFGGKRPAYRAHEGLKHTRRLPEPHLGLRGMDVHVDHVETGVHEDHRCGFRIEVAQRAIRLAQSLGQAAVLDRTAIHIGADIGPGSTFAGVAGHEARDRNPPNQQLNFSPRLYAECKCNQPADHGRLP